MMCKKPFRQAGMEYGCGQCLPCRISRRRLWATRIQLESLCHEKSSFVTLTYSPEHLPRDNSLDPRHIQLFLKRLRRALEPRRIRFFAVGEYGERHSRPHYHLALFGVDRDDEPALLKAWGKGFVDVGDIQQESASYIAGYVVKKLTARDAMKDGRYPEFARMSLRPGIGSLAIEVIMQVVYSSAGSKDVAIRGDVPDQIHLNGKKVPLGRYLRNQLRDAYGIAKKTPDEVMRVLQQSSPLYNLSPTEFYARESLREQHGRNALARIRLYFSRRKL